MLNTLKTLYGFQPISFKSIKSVDEVRLSFLERLKPTYHMSFIKKPIKGYLKKTNIFLYRQPSSLLTMLTVFLGSVDFYYPIFKGTLIAHEGETILYGKFTINLGSKIILSFLYIFLLFAFIALNITVIEVYIESEPSFLALSLTWLMGFLVIASVSYFLNFLIKKATLPNRKVFSELTKFIEECIN